MFVDFASVKRAENEWLNTYSFNLNFTEAPAGYSIEGNVVTGFVEWVLNAGFNKSDGAGGKVKIYENNEPVTSPVPLDSSGNPLGTATGEASFCYLDFMPYHTIDFISKLPDFPEKL